MLSHVFDYTDSLRMWCRTGVPSLPPGFGRNSVGSLVPQPASPPVFTPSRTARLNVTTRNWRQDSAVWCHKILPFGAKKSGLSMLTILSLSQPLDSLLSSVYMDISHPCFLSQRRRLRCHLLRPWCAAAISLGQEPKRLISTPPADTSVWLTMPFSSSALQSWPKCLAVHPGPSSPPGVLQVGIQICWSVPHQKGGKPCGGAAQAPQDNEVPFPWMDLFASLTAYPCMNSGLLK